MANYKLSQWQTFITSPSIICYWEVCEITWFFADCLKSKNSLKRDDTRNIVQARLNQILKISILFINWCIFEILKIHSILVNPRSRTALYHLYLFIIYQSRHACLEWIPRLISFPFVQCRNPWRLHDQEPRLHEAEHAVQHHGRQPGINVIKLFTAIIYNFRNS
jgi:hypothetical protein